MKPNSTWYANSQRIRVLMISVISGHALAYLKLLAFFEYLNLHATSLHVHEHKELFYDDTVLHKNSRSRALIFNRRCHKIYIEFAC